MKSVLLIESRKHRIPLLSLMKFSSYFKSKGYDVIYVKGIQYFSLPKKIDKILGTCVFTFDLPEFCATMKHYQDYYQLKSEDVYVGGVSVSLLPKYVEERLGNVNIHNGLCDKINDSIPDYNVYPDTTMSITRSSQGCIRKCEFCCIPKIEGKLKPVLDWEKNINFDKPHIEMLDNSFTANKKEWVEHVSDRLSYFGKTVDFNQSTDIRILKEYHMDCFKKIKLTCLRFSYDGDHVDENKVRKGVELAQSYDYSDIRFDVLYNFEDTPEEFYHRLDVLNELDCKAFAMRYIPLDSFTRTFVGEHWSSNRLSAFNKLMGTGFSNGMIGNGKGTRKTFLDTFGNNGEEFVKKLDNIFVNKKGEIDKNQNTFDKWM